VSAVTTDRARRGIPATVLAAAMGLLLASRAGADVLAFDVAPGTRVLKTHRAKHELRIDEIAWGQGEAPPVGEGTGGWISASQDISYVDEYLKTEPGRALDLLRSIRQASSKAEANVVRRNQPSLREPSQSASPLLRQNVRFTWIEAEKDWSKRYDKVDAEEEWLEPLRVEFDLLALLPPADRGSVEAGDTWSVDPLAFRDVLAPGGNLQLTPTGGGMFGRTTEVGVAGDFADSYESPAGRIEATYKGRRTVSVGEGDAAVERVVGVVALDIQIACTADRTMLYRMAMPETERRENTRLDEVALESTLFGTGELLWDLEAKRFHSLEVRAKESFAVTVRKTGFDGRAEVAIVSLSRYSGTLELDVACRDAAGLELEKELDNPKVKGGGRRPKQK
jgi:hypothetical protein